MRGGTLAFSYWEKALETESGLSFSVLVSGPSATLSFLCCAHGSLRPLVLQSPLCVPQHLCLLGWDQIQGLQISCFYYPHASCIRVRLDLRDEGHSPSWFTWDLKNIICLNHSFSNPQIFIKLLLCVRMCCEFFRMMNIQAATFWLRHNHQASPLIKMI